MVIENFDIRSSALQLKLEWVQRKMNYIPLRKIYCWKRKVFQHFGLQSNLLQRKFWFTLQHFFFFFSVLFISPWDQSQIGIKLGTEHVYIPKVSKFYEEKGYLC